MTRAYQARALHDGVKPGFRAVVDNPDGWPIAHCMALGDAEQIAAALNATPSQRLDAATVDPQWCSECKDTRTVDCYRPGCPMTKMDAATVERCAQVADAVCRSHRHPILGGFVYDAVRALATDPHQHGGKGA